MAAPNTTDIESVYRTAESNGLTRDQVDQIAIPLIRVMGTVRSLRDVRSNGELRAIAAAISDATPKTAATVDATPRQIDYATGACAAGRRLGVNGEVWDD